MTPFPVGAHRERLVVNGDRQPAVRKALRDKGGRIRMA
jgi:hypothetical protein